MSLRFHVHAMQNPKRLLFREQTANLETPEQIALQKAQTFCDQFKVEQANFLAARKRLDVLHGQCADVALALASLKEQANSFMRLQTTCVQLIREFNNLPDKHRQQNTVLTMVATLTQCQGEIENVSTLAATSMQQAQLLNDDYAALKRGENKAVKGPLFEKIKRQLLSDENWKKLYHHTRNNSPIKFRLFLNNYYHRIKAAENLVTLMADIKADPELVEKHASYLVNTGVKLRKNFQGFFGLNFYGKFHKREEYSRGKDGELIPHANSRRADGKRIALQSTSEKYMLRLEAKLNKLIRDIHDHPDYRAVSAAVAAQGGGPVDDESVTIGSSRSSRDEGRHSLDVDPGSQSESKSQEVSKSQHGSDKKGVPAIVEHVEYDDSSSTSYRSSYR